MNVKTTTVSSWQQFMNLLPELDGWAFRGQQDANWLLQSSLSRYLSSFVPDRSTWRIQEQRAIRIFRRKAHNYLHDVRALSDDLRCVGLMQHHGAPTRLLDFTKSPFVAAFFALERAVSDAAIFALNTPALWTNQAYPATTPHLTRDTIDPRRKGNFEKFFLTDKNPVIWFGEPSEMDQRLIAQAGTFVLPGLLQEPLDVILNNYSSDVELLRKIVLPQHVREDAMRSLYRMNITHASLFPDLEGLARSIALELEMVWPMQPR
jgi:hypothetical protein